MTAVVSKKSITHLEWSKLVEYLSHLCQSKLGESRALDLRPKNDRRAVLYEIELTEAAREVLEKSNAPSLEIDAEVGAKIDRAKVGARLEPETLIRVGKLMQTTRLVRQALVHSAPKVLADVADRLFVDEDLTDLLDRSFDEEGELSSQASPTLRTLRRTVAEQHEKLRRHLNQMLSDERIAAMLEQDYVTLRDERYVLPVKSRHKNHIDGIVHGWSQSGATVYVEPKSVVEANNRLMLAQSEVDVEVDRILRAMSIQVGQFSSELQENIRILGQIDLRFAMARLCQRFDGATPTLTTERELSLVDYRHPLLMLAGQPVVPNQFSLKEGQTALIITGPNTGGKTVALKSIGLLMMMLQAGLQIPASAKSRLPLISCFFTDIGDEQSLADNHSTFSGHIANLVNIMSSLTPGAAVMLDELVVGTDPGQGAALARAIVEHFVDRGCWVFVTTHYESLKNLASSDARIRNAAMGIDPSSSKPTYKLTLDLPGTSSALVTAERLGLEPSIVTRARDLLDPEQRDRDEKWLVVDALKAKLLEREKELQFQLVQLKRQGTALEERKRRIEDREERIRQKAYDELLKEAQTLREEVKAQRKALRQKKVHQDHLSKVKGTAEEAISAVFKARRQQSQDLELLRIEDLEVGQNVYIRTARKPGSIERIDAQKAQCVVRVGQFAMTVPVRDLGPFTIGSRTATSPQKKRKNVQSPQPSQAGATPTTSLQSSQNTVDLRGRDVDTAIAEADKFIDTCLLRNEMTVFLIHGHGEGKLKKAIREWLKGHSAVATHSAGDRYEGGDGVTVVSLH